MSILDSIPDISFIGDIWVEKLKEIGINEYKSALSEITGETVTQISDEDKAKIYAQAQKQDGFNLDFGKYDDKTAVVNYDEVNGKYSSFGRDRYICYKNVEFAEPAYSASISLATGQQGGNIVAICVDSKTNQVGEIFFPTDSWSTPTEKKIFLDKPISKGTHDLYIMMTAGYGDLFGVDFYPKLKKSDDFIPENIYDDVYSN